MNSIHVLNTQYEPQLFSTHEKVKSDAYFWLNKTLTCAKTLGAKYYTFHGIARYKQSSRNPANDNFARLGARIGEVSAFCKQKGVTLCLENVEWSTYTRPGLFNEMIKYVPDLRGVLDIKQARISGYPYEEYLTEMGNRLAYAHLSDIDDQGKMCLPGQGCFDFDTLVKQLKDVGFDGALLLEVYAENFTDPVELKQSCDYVDELLYKNNLLTE
jgi:sugar phosphate isomerase/epimerase